MTVRRAHYWMVLGAVLVAVGVGCSSPPVDGDFRDAPSACRVADNEVLPEIADGLSRVGGDRGDERIDDGPVQLSRCVRSFARESSSTLAATRVVTVEVRRYEQVEGPDGPRVPTVAAFDGFMDQTEDLDSWQTDSDALRGLGDQAQAGVPNGQADTAMVVFALSNLLVTVSVTGTNRTDMGTRDVLGEAVLDQAVEYAGAVARGL